MPLIYITGLEGTGKSTVCQELVHRGFSAHDMDKEKIATIHDKETGMVVKYPRNPVDRTGKWRLAHSWRIVDSRFKVIEKEASESTVFLCGTAENEREYLNRFSLVIALVTDNDTIKNRLLTRTGENNYGKNVNELNVVLNKQKTVKHYYNDIGARTIDSAQPVSQIVNELTVLIT